MEGNLRKKELDLFWKFVNERHRIWLFRDKNPDVPPPWTKDKILSTYKFTNVFRQLDRTTIEFNERMAKLEDLPEHLVTNGAP